MLQIAPYGGISDNIITYRDARITSLELPEQNETAGVQNQEYTIQFEAYEDTSVVKNKNNPAGTDGVTNPTYKLSSVEESWELTPAEGKYVYKDNKLAGGAVIAAPSATPPVAAADAADTPYKTFTLTHSLSATGLKKFHQTAATAGLANDGESWRQAAKYIGARLAKTGDPLSAIGFNTLNQEEDAASNKFNPSKMDSDDTNLGYNLSDDTVTNPAYDDTIPDNPVTNPPTLPNDGVYKAYDHVRTVSSDVSGGSYSVTDTWVIAYGNTTGQSAIIDTEISLDNSNMEAANTVTISGTVTGLDTTAATAQQHNKYINAKAAYDKLALSFFDAAKALHEAYLDVVLDTDGENVKPLKTTEYSKTVGESQTTGTITFSVSFNDRITQDANAIEDTIQVDDNGGTDVVAIIGVLLKANGPVIQDMGTITEKRTSVTYTAKMKTGSRTAKPTHGTTVVDAYKPTNGYLASNSESWNKTTGDYSITKEWIHPVTATATPPTS